MTAQPDRPDSEATDIPQQEPPAEEAAEAASEEQAEAAEPSLEELQAKVQENWEKYLRTYAEMENVRKRAVRDVENARKFALEKFSNELLAVRDSLEMGLGTAGDADVAAIRAGAEATLKQLSSVMERFGVEEVDPEGEPFDPQLHEAMTMQPSADVEPGTVLTVFQKGYSLNGRLLRPARVVVAMAPVDAGEKS